MSVLYQSHTTHPKHLIHSNSGSDTEVYDKTAPMDKTVTEKELDYVAGNISPRQSRRLLRKLGLKDVTIDQVFEDFKDEGSRERLYQGLRKCKEHRGSGFTIFELVKALVSIGRADLIENLTAEKSPIMLVLQLLSGLSESDAKSIQSMIEEIVRNKKGGGQSQQPHAFLKHGTDETLK